MRLRRKSVLCVFAHPDDEAFGPGGTIAKLAKRHRVYLLAATKGQAGKDRGRRATRDLARRRATELRASAKILGVRKVFFLGFADGALSNNLYHRLAASIERYARRFRPEVFMTHEPRGGSGHLDHIAVSMAVSYVFERLPFVRALLYSCLRAERARALRKGYFIYVPPGYRRSEIDLRVDTRDVWEQRVEAMQAHASQSHDLKRILRFAERFPKEENFLVLLKGARAGLGRAARGAAARRMLGL
ncbi:MAG: hypothetical protein A3A44_00805 [Candidatus Sungbacteria bacterium RIFCSPLOWO2_01_FULL_60_25]|uniref:GlcNAc-PI de-N-acetylase n=1 Tax=Candidatus Sungbacteria bacterium RIFCSPLOWO2_01_FULL_60_25 TaxID=1802281 RepID=A0A1G2LCB7_9BACT|nr:MAG: hypothetical protein A3A44_00805 [Candidatus Sungbacteria bacterium RIFCSPLOWO2_01_FULL_60_25]